MSLDALVAEAGRSMRAARGLFGQSPAGGEWTTTPTLEAGRGAVSGAVQAAGGHWRGAGGQTYVTAGRGHVAGLDSVVGADYHTTPGLQGAVRTASLGGAGVDGAIEQTRAGVGAIAPSTATPAGRAALISLLQGQLSRVKAVLTAAEERNLRLAMMVRSASGGYRAPMSVSPMGGGGGFGTGGGGGGVPSLPGLSGLFSGHRGHVGHSGAAGQHYAMRGGGPSAQMAVKAALTKLGRPYVWGAKGPEAFDCSGLVHWAYAQAGVTLGADTYTMIGQGTAVAPGDVQAGDLVFPRSSFDSRGPGHILLAISPTECVEAQQSGVPVKVSPMPGAFVARRVA